jgi:hypothetical protein
MTGWSALAAELDCWADAGQIADFWWRDDDAVTPGRALDRLLALAEGRAIPLALAAIPAHATPALAARLVDTSIVKVLVHGYAHENHAPSGEKKCEFGAERDPETVHRELADGLTRLEDLFGALLRPILVPPWNRLADQWLPALANAGYRGLSRHLARASGEPVPGLRQVNVHVDIIDWRGGRSFLGTDATLALACDHLVARRRGEADGDEPTGILTHHLDHDEGCWAFAAEFAAFVTAHPAARWLDADQVFGPGP